MTNLKISGKNGGKKFSFILHYLPILIVLVEISVTVVSSERILFLLPLSSKSHKIFFEPLIIGLAERNHKVTVLTNEKTNWGWSNHITQKNVEELVPLPSQELMSGFPDPFNYRKSGKNGMSFPFKFVINGCHKVIQSEVFQNVMMDKSPQKKFDLIIVDSFLSNCLDGFIYKTGIPFILVTTMPAPSYIAERVGNFLPPSIIPVLSFRGYTEPDGEMYFLERLRNFVHFLLARVYVNYIILPSLEKVYKNYLGEDFPGIFEIEEKSKMIFMNSHYSMNFARPVLPSLLEIGGIQCRKSKPLINPDLTKFISKTSSPNGFIYFSIGSIIKMSNAPSEFIHVLLQTFSKLDQRVVFKWQKELNQSSMMTFPKMGIYENIWIDDWLPQQDILGHDNIRLFISHGGLLSMQEAVYHGVPVLGIPFGVDQDTNVYNAVLQGYALKLELNLFTEETLTTFIQQILNDSSFLQNAGQISKAFRQRQATPLDTAVYWTEHVLSTINDNITHFIQSPARKMNIWQYYSYDIILFLTITLVVITIVFLAIIKWILKCVKNLVIIIVQRHNSTTQRNVLLKKLQ